MTIFEAGRKTVVNSSKPKPYLVGFNDGDETELGATSLSDLEELWLSLAKELGAAPNGVDYIEALDSENEEDDEDDDPCASCKWASVGPKVIRNGNSVCIQTGVHSVACTVPGGVKSMSISDRGMVCSSFTPKH